MSNTNTAPVTPALKGALVALVLILMGLVIYFTGNSQNKAFGYIQMAVFVFGVIGSGMYYAHQQQGNVTFGNVFAEGFKTAAAATGIFLVYTYLAIKFIMPEIVDLSMEAARKGMIEQKMPPAQMEQALGMMQKFFVPFAIGGSLLIYLILGLIAALIGGTLAKKNPNPSPFAQS